MNTLSAPGLSRLPPYKDNNGDRPSGLALLMDELAYGMLIVDLQGQLLHANHMARQELGRSALLGMAGNTLRPRRPEHVKIWLDALAKVADGKRSMVGLTQASGANLTLAVLPLQDDGDAAITRAAVVFARNSVCESLTLCFFARSHGLTNTEEQVLGILCQGYSTPQIAAELKVAVSTVRSHVRSLCAKTYSNGARQLLNRVAMLPPVVPALRLEQMH